MKLNNFNNWNDIYWHLYSWLVSWDFPTFWSFRWLYYYLTWRKLNYFWIKEINFITSILWLDKYKEADVEGLKLLSEQEQILEGLLINWYNKSNLDLYMLLKNYQKDTYYKQLREAYNILVWNQTWTKNIMLDELNEISKELWLEIIDFSVLFTQDSLRGIFFSKDFSKKVFYANDYVKQWVNQLKWSDLVKLYTWYNNSFISKKDIEKTMSAFWKIDMAAPILARKKISDNWKHVLLDNFWVINKQITQVNNWIVH